MEDEEDIFVSPGLR